MYRNVDTGVPTSAMQRVNLLRCHRELSVHLPIIISSSVFSLSLSLSLFPFSLLFVIIFMCVALTQSPHTSKLSYPAKGASWSATRRDFGIPRDRRRAMTGRRVTSSESEDSRGAAGTHETFSHFRKGPGRTCARYNAGGGREKGASESRDRTERKPGAVDPCAGRGSPPVWFKRRRTA